MNNLRVDRLNLCMIILALSVFTYLALNKPLLEYSVKDEKLKYILDFEYSLSYSSHYFPRDLYGQSLFMKRNCTVQNCLVTMDKNMFGDITKFDAILFNIVYTIYLNHSPLRRSPDQIYIFATVEPYAYTCINYSGFFNWTMTYKLNSDVPFPFIIVRDRNNKIIGPKHKMHWIGAEEIRNTSVPESVKHKLQTKRKAAIWMVSRCNSLSKREELAKDLDLEMKKYGLSIDVYGECGTLQCPVGKAECYDMIDRDYYFYLAFENSFGEDYVTEKVLRALRHHTVPIVYGGANYTRFIPEATYLDIRKLGPAEVARQMNELMQNPEKYYEYFKWHNFYKFHSALDSVDTDPFCHLCAQLHEKGSKNQVYEDFLSWWN